MIFKKVLINFIFSLIFSFTAVLFFFRFIGNHYYPVIAVIDNINYEINIISCYDNSGNNWEFYGDENYCVGDSILLLMYDNKTETIYDDSIEDVQFYN